MPKTHGLSKTSIYHVLEGIKDRCRNPHNKSYKNYGARGITLCDEWANSYPEFYRWAISSGYEEGLTIERINNNEGYSPENCRWVPKCEQSRNRRNTIWITYNGKTQCLTEWARELGIPRKTIKSRLLVGRSIEEALDKTDWRKNNGGRKKTD